MVQCHNCKQFGHYSDRCHLPKRSIVKNYGKIQCYNCKQFGHYSEKCPQSITNSTQVRCYKCGELGHYSDKCVDVVRENKNVEEKHKDEKPKCSVCMENEISQILYPCKHICLCELCGSILNECPLCRTKIESRDKVYL